MFFTFMFTRLIFQIFVLFAYAYPLLGEQFGEVGNEWWEIALLVEMILATGVGALMNAYWMYLIIHQAIRMFNRLQRGESFELETSGPNELMSEGTEKDQEDEGDGAVASTDDDQERVPLMNRKRRSERKNRHNSESSDLSAGEKRSV